MITTTDLSSYLPADALAAAADPRVHHIVYYADGFLPLAYRWSRTGTYVHATRTPDGWEVCQGKYRMLRSRKAHVRWVASSARRGRLASG